MKRRFRFQKMIRVTISLERFFFCFMSLFWPCMAMFYVSGLAACGFESLPLGGFLFFNKWIISLRLRECVYGRKIMNCRLISLFDVKCFICDLF